MKKTLSVLFFIVVLLSGAWADVAPPGTQAEFYWTRVIYSGFGRGGFGLSSRGFGSSVRCADLVAGEGGFGGGGSWATDYPASDCKFMWGVERLTGISVFRE